MFKINNKLSTIIFIILLVAVPFFIFTNIPTVRAVGISIVQGPYKGSIIGNGVSNFNITLGSNPTNGNLLILTYGSGNSPATEILSIEQTGVVWTEQIAQSATGVVLASEIWAGVVSAGAGVDIRVTGTSSNFPYGGIADVVEWTGLLTSGMLDQTGSDWLSTSSTSSSGVTPSTTQNDELAIACISVYNANQSDPTQGFTLLDGLMPATYSQSVGYCYKVLSATGAVYTNTSLTGSTHWNGVIATFKGAEAVTTTSTTTTTTTSTSVTSTSSITSTSVSTSVFTGVSTQTSISTNHITGVSTISTDDTSIATSIELTTTTTSSNTTTTFTSVSTSIKTVTP